MACIALLIVNNFTEKIQARQSGFTALPGKIDLIARRCDILLDELFQSAVIHPFFMSKLRLFFKVKTVITFEITLKTGGLGCNVHRYLAQ